MEASQLRQRPRRTAQETSGTLSYHATGVSQLMQAEPGLTIERFSGSRAATTFRKLPSARPGARTMAASVSSMTARDLQRLEHLRGRAVQRPPLLRLRERVDGRPGVVLRPPPAVRREGDLAADD